MNATEQKATATLVLEIELPEFYAEDMRPDNAQWRSWLEEMGTDPNDAAAVTQEILNNIGEVYSGLLTVEVSGEKDSTIQRTPVNVIGARVEDREPPEVSPNAQHLAERLDEDEEIRREEEKEDRAMINEQLHARRAADELLRRCLPLCPELQDEITAHLEKS